MAYTTINKPSDYFNTKLYSASGSGQSITGVGFQPDWTWIKARSDGGGHALYDSVRGTTKRLASHNNNAEGTVSGGVTAFDADGFTVGNDGDVNSASSIASWNWLAGGTASSNTDGSITSNVSASTTSGFSIVSYSGNGTGGATVGHGLGSALGLIILKCRDTAGTSWQMFHKSLGATKSINLEDTAAAATSTAYWNDTAPTSSVFSLGTGGDFNNGSRTYVAYCFAEKQGYSKFGSYTGNGNADGTFVYTGFKPAFVMSKYTTGGSAGGEGWNMFDNKRDPFNIVDLRLQANSSSAESSSTNHYHDFLSNGFKLRTVDGSANNSGATYIYMAFAENPFVTSTGVPATAR